MAKFDCVSILLNAIILTSSLAVAIQIPINVLVNETSLDYSSPCKPVKDMINDECQRALYPNKYRMVCDKSLKKCVCAVARYSSSEGPPVFKQMKFDNKTQTCVGPSLSACYPYQPLVKTMEKGKKNFTLNVNIAHSQCDDDKPVDDAKRTLLCARPNKHFRKTHKHEYFCLKKGDRSGAGRRFNQRWKSPYVVLTLVLITFNTFFPQPS